MAEKLHVGTGFSNFLEAEKRMYDAGERATATYMSATVIPGLMHTEPYAYALFDERIVPVSADIASGSWAERRARQEAFFEPDNPPRGVFLIARAAITEVRRYLSPPDGVDQLTRMQQTATLPQIDVQFFEPDRRLPAAVYTIEAEDKSMGYWAEELQLGGFAITEPGQVEMAQAAISHARELAGSTDAAHDFIESQINALRSEL